MQVLWNKTAWGLSFLLGRASVLLGVLIALAWTCAFAAIVAQHHGPRMLLPVEPPLIGLALGLAGWLIGESARQQVSRYALAGVLFNALALGLAMFLIWQRAMLR